MIRADLNLQKRWNIFNALKNGILYNEKKKKNKRRNLV